MLARRLIFSLTLATALCRAVTPAEVLIIVNDNSPVSRSIAEYYARRRAIPPDQIVHITAPGQEEIPRAIFQSQIAAPVAEFLRRKGWIDRILVFVTTTGVPLKISGAQGMGGDAASVDSELAALYLDLRTQNRDRQRADGAHSLPGPLANPYFGKSVPFRHPQFPLYLVTRLTGYTFADARALIDRALQAKNRGSFVLDLKSYDLEDGNSWLKSAANSLPRERVLLDESTEVLRGARNVIGYASWGSNDPQRKDRDLGFSFLPGALVTEYVSTDARTFMEPPASWTLGDWKNRLTHFAGSPQSLSADFIRQGATGVSGHVYEPFLSFTPRPQLLFPNYLSGLTLAESFYSAMPAISWMNIVVGDPLCRLAP